MKYKVTVKQIYRYENIEAKSKEEAIQKVLDSDWQNHDEQDTGLETKAEIENEDD